MHTAALNLQHLVLCEIRRLAGEGATTDLSRLLEVSTRTVQRITAGDHLLGIDEMVELACLFGDEVLDTIPRTVTELFPEPYRPYLEKAWVSPPRSSGLDVHQVISHPGRPYSAQWPAGRVTP